MRSLLKLEITTEDQCCDNLLFIAVCGHLVQAQTLVLATLRKKRTQSLYTHASSTTRFVKRLHGKLLNSVYHLEFEIKCLKYCGKIKSS